MAVFGNIRIGVTAPWTQKRRIVRQMSFEENDLLNFVRFQYSQIGMVKSPVEGSSAALIRLQSPVVYSDFVRPICLPDDDFTRNSIVTDYPESSALYSKTNKNYDRPHAEKYYFGKKKTTFTEDRQFFLQSDKENEKEDEDDEALQQIYHEIVASELIDEQNHALKPEAQFQTRSIASYAAQKFESETASKQQFSQCNTLGWSRQKEHLQRVQLNMIEMKACENISITTVNSLCAEAAYHKQDCNVS